MTTQKTNLNVMLLNAENLFLLSDTTLSNEHLKLDATQWNRLSTSIYDNKPLDKLKAIAKLIEEKDPDIILLCEVGGLESLNNFNRLFLNDKYSPALVEGNSKRNIDVGYLIRKNIGFYFDLISNKNRPINYLYPHERQSIENGFAVKSNLINNSHKFSRDATELHLFLKDRERPFFVFILTHLKSRLDPESIDPNGFERRQAEMKTVIEIYGELLKKFPNTPMAVAGDLNGNASKYATSPEFEPVYKMTDLVDVCELAQIPVEKRVTFYQVGKSNDVEGRQLDYCFLSSEAAKLLKKESVHVYNYKDPMGFAIDKPTTMEAKGLMPSDHNPIFFRLENVPVK